MTNEKNSPAVAGQLERRVMRLDINDSVERLGLDDCDFDDECDFCENPKNGSFAKLVHTECGEETEYYICGDCVLVRESQTGE